MVIVLHNGMGTGGDDSTYAAFMNGNGTAATPRDHDQERHEQFVAALDNFPMENLGDVGAMEHLASTLGWPLSEVELHA